MQRKGYSVVVVEKDKEPVEKLSDNSNYIALIDYASKAWKAPSFFY